jgi:hypothetical protein
MYIMSTSSAGEVGLPEDLAYAIGTGRDGYLDKSLTAMEWLWG